MRQDNPIIAKLSPGLSVVWSDLIHIKSTGNLSLLHLSVYYSIQKSIHISPSVRPTSNLAPRLRSGRLASLHLYSSMKVFPWFCFMLGSCPADSHLPSASISQIPQLTLVCSGSSWSFFSSATYHLKKKKTS